MVKKRLADGSQCRKCCQVSELLERRGYLGRIDEVVWALEGDPESEGMKLARAHKVEVAPFFIVESQGRQTVYTSGLKMMRECFEYEASLIEELEEKARAGSSGLVLP